MAKRYGSRILAAQGSALALVMALAGCSPTVPETVNVQLMPPRLEIIVPPAVLPAAFTVSGTLLAALRAPRSMGAVVSLRSASHA